MSSNDTEVYARVSDGKIVEYPVFALHIRNRAHPFDWYTKVEFQEKPVVPEFHNLKENLSITLGHVVASYEIIPQTINEVLYNLHHPNGTPPMPGEEPPAVTIAEVPPAVIQRVAKLATDKVEQRLNAWANTRNYESILSAVSYVNSPIPNFQADSQKAVQVRDTSWVALYQYLDKVTSSQVPVPKTFEDDIEPHLPVPSWD